MKTATRTLFDSLKLSLALLALFLLAFSATLWRTRARAQQYVGDARAQALRQRCRMPRYATVTNEWMPAQTHAWQSLGPLDYGVMTEPCEAESPTTTIAALPAEPEYDRFTAAALLRHGEWLFGVTEKHGVWRGAAHKGKFLWQHRGNPYGKFIAVDASERPALYVTGESPLVSKSLDYGDEFRAAANGLTEETLTAPLVIDANDAQRLWAGGRFLWRTLDGAAHWEQASASLPGSAANRVSALAVSAVNSGFALAGTSEGYILRTQEAFTVNAESAWRSVRPRGGRVSSLTFDPYNANAAYATYDSGSGAQVWRTRNAGASWESLNETLPDVAAHALVVDPSNPARLYLATELGLFVSLDAGAHWAVEETGFGAAAVTALVVDAQSQETLLYAFAHGRGVWRVRLHAVAETAQQCTYSISPVSLRFDAAGGTGSVNVTTQANCAWTVTNPNNWITVTSGASGSGNGVVALSVAAHTARELRTGTLTIAGRTFTVEQTGQGGNCVVTPLQSDQPVTGTLAAGDCLSSYSNTRNALADRYTFTAQAGQLAIITMTATTPNYVPYLVLFGPNGSPVIDSAFNAVTEARIPNTSGLYTFRDAGTYTLEAIALNPGSTGDYRLTLTIYPVGCEVYTLTPARQAFAAAGGSGSVQVSAGRNCPWTATTTANWITLTSGALGTGSLPLSFTVAPNTGAYRTATINVGPQSFIVEQGAPGGNCIVQSIVSGQLIEGSLDETDCDQPSRNPNTASRAFADRFRFSAVAGQKLSLSLVSRNQPTAPSVSLMNAGGQVIADSSERTTAFARNEFAIPSTGDYLLELSWFAQNTRNDYALRINLTQPGCGYATVPVGQAFEAAGGGGSFTVAAGSGCAWTATTETSWLNLTAVGSGTGTGVVGFSVQPNTGADYRRGAISVGGRTFVVEQAGTSGSCTTRPIAVGQSITDRVSGADCRTRRPANFGGNPPMAKRYSFTGRAGQQVRIRLAQASQLYLYLATAGGRAIDEGRNGVLPFSGIDAQSTGFLTLPEDGTYVFEVTFETASSNNFATSYTVSLEAPAAATGCEYRVQPSRVVLDAAAGSGSFTVTAGAGCAWTARSVTSWLTLTEGGTGSGNGMVKFNVTANPATVLRRAALIIAGQTVAVDQAGIGGTCAAQPIAAQQTVRGTLKNSDCLARLVTGTSSSGSAMFGHVYAASLQAGEQVVIELGNALPFAAGVVLTDSNERILLRPEATSGFSRLPGTGFFTVPATGTYLIEIAGNAGLTYDLTLTSIPASCNFALGATEQRLAATGGTGSFAVTAGVGCAWRALPQADWITITSGGNGTGNGTVGFTVAANTTATMRSGTISVAGRAFTVMQAGTDGNCVPVELPLNTTLNANLTQSDCRARFRSFGQADTYRFNYTANQQIAIVMTAPLFNQPGAFQPELYLFDQNGVQLDFVVNQSNIARLPRGTGFMTLPAAGTYFIEATGATSTGTYTVRLETPTNCAYTLSPGFQLFNDAGGTGMFRVVSGATCNWMATLANTPWITLTSASGMGLGAVNFTVAANNSGTARRGAITVGGESFIVEQAAGGGNCLPAALTLNQPVQGSLAAADCMARYGPQLSQQSTGTTFADRYTFNAAAGDRLRVLAQLDRFFGTNEVSLLDPLGRRVTLNPFGGNNIESLTFITLTATGTYVLEIGTNVSGANYTLLAQLVGAACNGLEAGAALQVFEFDGGSGSLPITAGSACAWTALTQANWITLSNATGMGAGTVNFTVARNTSPAARNGTIVVGDRVVTIAQGGAAGNCATAVLRPGEFVNDSVTTADCITSLVPTPTPSPGALPSRVRARRYTFAGKVGDQVSLHLFLPGANNAGGPATLNVIAPDGSVLARNNPAFFGAGRLPASGWLILPQPGTYQVEVLDGRNEGSTPFQLLLTQTPAACNFAIAPFAQSFESAGGAGSLRVTSGCAWTAATPANWVALTNPTGSGDGTVNFTVARNTTNNYRTTQILVGDQMLNLTQAGAGGTCSVMPLTPNVPVTGSLNQADCPSQVRRFAFGTTVNWADRYSFTAAAGQQVKLLLQLPTFGGSSGVPLTLSLLDANGTVLAQGPQVTNFGGVLGSGSVPDNGFFALPGTGTYFVELASYNAFNYTLTAQLNAAGCDYAVTPLRQTVNGTNATPGRFNVIAGAGCQWTATSDASWLTLTGATNGVLSGTGNGVINFTAANNVEAGRRSATIRLGDQVVTVEQGGRDSSCEIVMLTPGQTATGDLADGDCVWRDANTLGGGIRADAYRFSGQAGQRLQVTFTGTNDSQRPLLALYAVNGAPLLQFNGNTLVSATREYRLPARGFFTLPATGDYFLDVVNVGSGNGRYTLNIALASACAYAVTNAAYTFEAAGGAGQVALQTACDWALVSNASWITTTARGAGNDTASFTVAPNPNAAPRTGTLNLGATTITVTQLARTAITSAASFRANEFAPNSIATAFGQGLAQSLVVANTAPLPTQLAGTMVRLRDSRNVTREAPLFVVSPGQINFLIPAETALGAATVLIVRDGDTVATGEINLVAVAPGLFAANADGQGVPAGVVLRVRNEAQSFEPLVRFDAATNRFVAVPIDLGPAGDEVFLILFGTGFRNRAQNGAVTATIGAETAEVFFAGAQGSFAGLDQINLRVPRVLLGRGLANLAVTIEGKPLNLLQVTIR